SKLGGGTAKGAAPPIVASVNAKVTLFNGETVGGYPSVIIYSLPDLGPVLTMSGALKPDRGGRYGYQLSVDVPPIKTLPSAPDASTAVVGDAVARCLAGNHDLVVRGDIDIGYFAMSAGAAARWTVKVINEQTREFLRPLAPLGESAGVGLYHASPRDPVWEYVLSVRQAADCLQAQRQRVALIGHSHVACYFSRPNGQSTIEETIGEIAEAGTVLEMADARWLVNPGSVGQPRDGHPRAAWL